MLWWKVAKHLDETQLALANAMAHNVDDPRPVHALQERLREGQAILLEIFRMKGLLPGSPNGKATAGAPMPDVPVPPIPGVPAPTAPNGEVVAASSTNVEPQAIAAEEPAVAEADHAAAAESAAAESASSPDAASAPEIPTAAPADSGPGGTGG
jgi:hypothetical protein